MGNGRFNRTIVGRIYFSIQLPHFTNATEANQPGRLFWRIFLSQFSCFKIGERLGDDCSFVC